jgi:hypothetical protein
VLRRLTTAVVLGITWAVIAAEKAEASPEKAQTTAEILKWVETAKGFGIVSTAEFRRADKQMFVVWYNPYSGRAACHVHGYVFDTKAGQWVRHLDRVFEGTHRVAVEVGSALTIRDARGQVVYKDKAME